MCLIRNEMKEIIPFYSISNPFCKARSSADAAPSPMLSMYRIKNRERKMTKRSLRIMLLIWRAVLKNLKKAPKKLTILDDLVNHGFLLKCTTSVQTDSFRWPPQNASCKTRNKRGFMAFCATTVDVQRADSFRIRCEGVPTCQRCACSSQDDTEYNTTSSNFLLESEGEESPLEFYKCRFKSAQESILRVDGFHQNNRTYNDHYYRRMNKDQVMSSPDIDTISRTSSECYLLSHDVKSMSVARDAEGRSIRYPFNIQASEEEDMLELNCDVHTQMTEDVSEQKGESIINVSLEPSRSRIIRRQNTNTIQHGQLDKHTSDCALSDDVSESVHTSPDSSPSKCSSSLPFQSEAMAKISHDPCSDFAASITEIIVAHELTETEDLEDLFQCYLQLNRPIHHPVIKRAFLSVLANLNMIH